MIRDDLKDWEIARMMFGLNTKVECAIVKKLRKHQSSITKLCEDYSIIYDKTEDDCGWVIPNECLKK